MDWFRILPHRCLLCDALARAYLCDGCYLDLPTIEQACLICGLPLASGSSCGDCLAHSKPYTRTLCAFPYAFPMNLLIQRFKNHSPVAITELLGPFLLRRIIGSYPAHHLPEALVPVPLHWTARLKRGFNQSEQLADWLAKQLAIPVERAVVRHRSASSQKVLRRRARISNLRGVFSCRESVRGRRVAIIDDVITTGGTTMSVALCLRKAGAERVDVWALARTPKPGFR